MRRLCPAVSHQRHSAGCDSSGVGDADSSARRLRSSCRGQRRRPLHELWLQGQGGVGHGDLTAQGKAARGWRSVALLRSSPLDQHRGVPRHRSPQSGVSTGAPMARWSRNERTHLRVVVVSWRLRSPERSSSACYLATARLATATRIAHACCSVNRFDCGRAKSRLARITPSGEWLSGGNSR